MKKGHFSEFFLGRSVVFFTSLKQNLIDGNEVLPQKNVILVKINSLFFFILILLKLILLIHSENDTIAGSKSFGMDHVEIFFNISILPLKK